MNPEISLESGLILSTAMSGDPKFAPRIGLNRIRQEKGLSPINKDPYYKTRKMIIKDLKD